ncbi:MAG: hypothetical protein QM820_13715 [Minicystis sp.]
MRPLTKANALILAAGVCAGLSLLAPSRAAAQGSPLAPPVIYNYGENETARSAAMGGALRAMGTGTTGVFLNPAAIPETRLYHIEASAQVTPETDRQVYGGTIVDSTTSRLCGSFSFLGGWNDWGGIDRSFLDMRLALAFPITDRFIIGLGGRYLKLTQSGLGPFGFSPVSGGLVDSNSTTTPRGRQPMVNAVTWDAGIVVRPTDSIYIAAVGQNLTYTKNGLLPLTVGGGIGYGSETFSIEADGIADIGSWDKPTARVGVGAEYVVSGMVPIRAGYRFDQGGKLHTVSLGTGYIHPVFSIEAAVKRTISNPGETSMVFSLAYHLDSSGVTKPTQPSAEVAQ